MLKAWLHGEFHPELKFQLGFWNKSSENQIVDYMDRDSARPNGPENLKKSHVIETEFQPRRKKEHEHAHWLCFRISVNFFTEICVFRPGWNWACNHNNIWARWSERNLSPGCNSPCNQALIDEKISRWWAKGTHAYHAIREKLRHPGRALDLKTKDLIGHLWVSLSRLSC